MLNGNKSTINIVTSCDNPYVQHTVVFLKSLFKKTQNTCKIFILVPDNFIHRKSVERNLSSHVSDLEFLKINLPENASFKVSHHVSVASYYRLFLDKLIPATISRVIYLDADILINGPLDELWAVDLQDCTIAAVSDANVSSSPSLREELEQKLKLAPTSTYFNSGVLLIDLSRWRDERLGERAIDFAISHPDLVTHWDQSALNHVVNGQFKELTKDWNFQMGHLRWTTNRRCTLDSVREVEAAKIIHFAGSLKPWHYRTNHPMKWLYWEYLRETEWQGYCPPDRNLLNILRKFVRKRAPVLANAGVRVRKLWPG